MTYTQIWDWVYNKISDTQILRDADQAFIPFDPDNTDYQEYLAWLAEGNTPSPPANMPAPKPEPPANTGPPTISGPSPFIVGAVATVNPGTWSGDPDLEYQWIISPGNTPIPDATETTYTAKDSDVGNRVQCEVTGTNDTGTASAISTNNFTVQPVPPVNTEAPYIEGFQNVGQVLTCNPGVWTPTPTYYFYQWVRDGDPIEDATDGEYTLVDEDEGTSITCQMTAQNSGGMSDMVETEPVEIAAAETDQTEPEGE